MEPYRYYKIIFYIGMVSNPFKSWYLKVFGCKWMSLHPFIGSGHGF